MEQLKVYACYNTDESVRLGSSSGAIFSPLAEYVLERKGIVYGVKMSDDCYSAEFARVSERTNLIELRGSKYLQAKVGNTYKRVKEDLIEGRLVLFSGTGCQVNGLKTFLGKEYDNLLCVDVICHGVPSPALWKKYAQCQERKSGGKLKDVYFRCKDNSWADFGLKQVFSNIPRTEQTKRLYIPSDKDPYMTMFLRNYCLRPSCYECVAKKVKMADLTLADFWGIENVAPEMNDGNGTSLVLIRTDKGRRAFELISSNLTAKEVSYEDGVRCNPSEYSSCLRPYQRDSFYDDMRNKDFQGLKIKYASVPLKSRVKRIAVKIIKAIPKFTRGGVNARKSMDYSLCFIFDCQEKNQ